jgi:ABC-type transporter Mla MlaB component
MARLEGVLASMRDVRPLVEAAKSRRTIGVDFSRVERIDFGFAPALCALLRGWGMQGRRVILANIAELHAELLQCVGLGAHVALLRRRLLEGEVADASGASNDDSVASAPILAAA